MYQGEVIMTGSGPAMHSGRQWPQEWNMGQAHRRQWAAIVCAPVKQQGGGNTFPPLGAQLQAQLLLLPAQ
jgi:hypothetical protein